MKPMATSLVIKAGSSIFQDSNCFASVAGLVVPIAQSVDKLFFVVSAVKGETDRTIDQIAGSERAILDNALQGRIAEHAQKWNNPEIAQQLVEPENYSARMLAEALHQCGISVRALQHGALYPLFGYEKSSYLYAMHDKHANGRYVSSFLGSENVTVIPGFGVRNIRGEIMCTGRGSSDVTAVVFAEALGIPEVIYWKDSGGIWRNPQNPQEGVFDIMFQEQVRRSERILDNRVYQFRGGIRVTLPGKIDGGTYIQPQQLLCHEDVPCSC
jgi:aspartokinase